MSELIEVGFWASPKSSDHGRQGPTVLPHAEDQIDLKWDPKERVIVHAYVIAGGVKNQYRGWSNCRICGKHNGSRDLTDGVYLWPEGLAHYIRDHGVRPHQTFIDHVLIAVVAGF